MPYKNKADQSACSKRHYEKNKAKIKARAKTHNKKTIEQCRAFIEELKKQPRMDCKNSFPTQVMEFDHVRGVKTGNVSEMVIKCFSFKTIREEIEKCELVCANCHRIRTWMRRQFVQPELTSAE